MSKLDVKHAFRICPVHPEDWHLLGYVWQDQYYVDIVLPFGGRSSPFIFNTFADCLEWILKNIAKIMHILHYLDDFFNCEATQSMCQQSMNTIQSIFSIVGVPLAADKIEGPLQAITYLGIEIDSHNMTIRLPRDKFSKLMNDIHTWLDKKKCLKRELLSLIGSLSFACKVVKAGRIFLRRLIDLSTTVKALHHHVTIDRESRKDLQWWCDFLPTWNGVELIQQPFVSSDDLELFTDASSIGLGGFWKGQWFSTPIVRSTSNNIAYLELLAIVVATFCWGYEWVNQQIILFTDNEAVVTIWDKGSCKDSSLMKLVRKLFFFTAKHNINLILKHVPGKSNIYADLLSRLQVEKFRNKCPEASLVPTAIPTHIWNL